MAIADDFTIDYVNQRIYHEPAGTTIYTVNQLYTYFTLTFDDDVQMDDLPPMSAQTPTSFTLENGWYIDPLSLQFLKGGSLNTLGWSHGAQYPSGIRILSFGGTYTGAEDTDIGKPVTSASGDNGTLLYFDNVQKKWWVRSNSLTDTFNASESISITGGTGTGTTSGASSTGENTWANIFTLGTLAPNTQIYIYQGNTRIVPWWNIGHIDTLILVKEAGLLIDNGQLTIFARQYSKLYDHFTTDLSTGARTPIPLATFKDTANPTGYRTFVGSDGSGAFAVGDIIYVQGSPTGPKSGIVTAINGYTLTYYLYKYPFTDFANSDIVTNGTATCTAADPTNTGPATLAGIVLTFGDITLRDLNNGSGDRPYDLVINCNQYPLSSVYEYLKYLTRYGSTDNINGYTGESYTGVSDVRLPYSNLQGGSFTAGHTVTGSASGATGVIVTDHTNTTPAALILKNVTGTWSASDTIQDGTVAADCGTPELIVQSKQAPFGTFAGGKFFGAQGVWLENYPGYEANNFELIDSEGVAQLPPQTISITVTSVANGDQVGVFRTTGDNDVIDKSVYNSHAANNTTGTGTFTVQQLIAADTPPSGYIRVVNRDGSGNVLGEDRYQYQSWFGSTFNLSGGVTLIRDYGSEDTAYVPYIDGAASDTSVTVTVSYVAVRYVLTRVRKKGIIPFTVTGQVTSAGLTVTAIRTPDTIQT